MSSTWSIFDVIPFECCTRGATTHAEDTGEFLSAIAKDWFGPEEPEEPRSTRTLQYSSQAGSSRRGDDAEEGEADSQHLRSREYRELMRIISTQQVQTMQGEILRAIHVPGSQGLRWMPFWEMARRVGIDHSNAKRMFALFDPDGDGNITEVEVTSVLGNIEHERGWQRYCPTCQFRNECTYCELVLNCPSCTREIWCPTHWSTHPGRPHLKGVDPFRSALGPGSPELAPYGQRDRQLLDQELDERRAKQVALRERAQHEKHAMAKLGHDPFAPTRPRQGGRSDVRPAP